MHHLLCRTDDGIFHQKCFLCGRCRHDGYRFVSVDDLEVAVSMPGVVDEAAACLLALQAVAFDADSIRHQLLPSGGSNEDAAAAAATATAAAVARLFTVRRKGVLGGVPTCWRGCALSDQLHQLLRQRAAPPCPPSAQATITDAPFSTGYLTYDPARYEELLQVKVDAVRRRFGPRFFPPHLAVEVHASPTTQFRQRCRLAVARDVPTDGLMYLLWDDEGWPSNRVEQFPVASKIINALLQPLRVAIEEGSAALRDGVQAAHFLSTLQNNVVVRLQYAADADLDADAWTAAAEAARRRILDDTLAVPGLRSLSLVARAKDTKLVAGADAVEERFELADGRVVRYLQSIDGFSNPNAVVNVKCLNWLCDVVKDIDLRERRRRRGSSSSGGGDGGGSAGTDDAKALDILELYCGNGNHTMALAAFARRVVAVELNKALCVAAEANVRLNGINNVTIVACDSESFARKILRSRKYVHPLPTTADDAAAAAAAAATTASVVIHDFSAVLVDPPRCGLDPTTRKLVQGYDHVIYISCGQDALERDMEVLAQTHDVQRFAVYDQFAYSTGHIECGVYLQKRDTTVPTTSS